MLLPSPTGQHLHPSGAPPSVEKILLCVSKRQLQLQYFSPPPFMVYELKGRTRNTQDSVTLEGTFLLVRCCRVRDAAAHPDVPYHAQRDCNVLHLKTHLQNNQEKLNTCIRLVSISWLCYLSLP